MRFIVKNKHLKIGTSEKLILVLKLVFKWKVFKCWKIILFYFWVHPMNMKVFFLNSNSYLNFYLSRVHWIETHLNYNITCSCCCGRIITLSIISCEESWAQTVQIARYSRDDFVVCKTEQDRNAKALKAHQNSGWKLIWNLKDCVLFGSKGEKNVLKSKKRNLKQEVYRVWRFQKLHHLTKMSVALTAFLMATGAGFDDFGWSFVINTRTMLIRNIVEQISRIKTGTVSIHI